MNIHFQKQKGVVVLLVSIVLLIGVTLISIFAARIGVMDQRISGNEYRHKEALMTADAALDQGAAYLQNNPELYSGEGTGWSDCTGNATTQATFPCKISDTEYEKVYSTIVSTSSIDPMSNMVELSSGANFETYLVFTTSASGNVITIAAVGESLDETGEMIVQTSFVQEELIEPGELPPLMAHSINLNGSFTIIPNPNGAGPGQPVSAWVNTLEGSSSGSWNTCHLDNYRNGDDICTETFTDQSSTGSSGWGGCACVENLSEAGDPQHDIVVETGTFPSPFEFVFGTSDYGEIKEKFRANGTVLANDCSALTQTLLDGLDKPWVWVTNGCDVPAIGTQDRPIILIVESANGDKAKINASTDLWGLLFAIGDLQANGTALIHGYLIAEGSADLSNGSYQQVYDPDIGDSLVDNDVNTVLSKRSFSWITRTR